MESLDIYILTSVVATLFIVFIVGTYRELMKVEKEGWKYDPNAKKYGRDALFVLAAKLFDDEKVPKQDKEVIYKAVNRTIADMESDGVYFDETVKEIIREKIDELKNEETKIGAKKADE